MKTFLSLVLLFILDTSYGRDDLIIPGKSVGIIHSKASQHQLQKLWGNQNVKSIDFPSDEGLEPK